MPEAPPNADSQIRYALRSELAGFGMRSDSFRSDGILPGCELPLLAPIGGIALLNHPGGVALLNHRLLDFIPPGCFHVLDAGGIPSCSRWLSATGATPPDPRPPETRTPAGVPAIARHAFDPHFPSLPRHLRDEKSGTDDRGPLACRTPLLPRRTRQRPRRPTTGNRWCCGSRPSSRFPEIHPLRLGLHAGIEKILVLMDPRVPSALLPMARRLRRLHRQRIGAGFGETIHRQPRGASPGEIIPRGTHRISQKIRRGIQGALSRLISSIHPHLLASLRDAETFSLHRPVVSLVPRSTTGYHLPSLRDARMMPETSYHVGPTLYPMPETSHLAGPTLYPMPEASHLAGPTLYPMPEASHPVAGGRAKRYHRNPASPCIAPRRGAIPGPTYLQLFR